MINKDACLLPGTANPNTLPRYTMKTSHNIEPNSQAAHRPAVFLDRDGTMIEDVGNVGDPSQVIWFEDTVSSLRRLCNAFDLFIVTNQAAVAQGALTLQSVHQVNAYITSHLAKYGIPIAATYVCPHERVSGCPCIKPNPYFLKKAEREFRIDLRRSFAVGDHPHDVEFAKNGGATGVYLLSGHGMKHREEMPPDTIVARGIGEAVERILQQTLHGSKRR